MMRKTMILAAALTVAAGMAGAGTGEKRSFGCEGSLSFNKDEVSSRATNPGMRAILQEYRIRWDAEHVRAQCDAFAAGEPYEISCLKGRRDWDAIAAMVPKNLHGLSAGALRPHFLALQVENDGFRDAIEFCRSVGALTSGR